MTEKTANRMLLLGLLALASIIVVTHYFGGAN